MNYELFVCVLISVCISYTTSEDLPCLKIISRETWRAQSPKNLTYNLKLPVDFAIIAHTVTPNCNGVESCSSLIRNIQSYHLNEKNWNDIGYNFLIASDGRIFEGVGYERIGTHTLNHNDNSIGIALIGNFTKNVPTEAQLQALRKLLECADSEAILKANYKLVGARQLRPTTSPGAKLFDIIKTWPHWTEQI